jgi:hypothetical protein
MNLISVCRIFLISCCTRLYLFGYNIKKNLFIHTRSGLLVMFRQDPLSLGPMAFGQLLLCLSKEVTKKRHRHRNAAYVVLVQTEWEVNRIHPRQPPAMPWANAQKQHQWQEHLVHLHRFRGPTHRGKSERKEATGIAMQWHPVFGK